MEPHSGRPDSDTPPTCPQGVLLLPFALGSVLIQRLLFRIPRRHGLRDYHFRPRGL